MSDLKNSKYSSLDSNKLSSGEWKKILDQESLIPSRRSQYFRQSKGTQKRSPDHSLDNVVYVSDRMTRFPMLINNLTEKWILNVNQDSSTAWYMYYTLNISVLSEMKSWEFYQILNTDDEMLVTDLLWYILSKVYTIDIWRNSLIPVYQIIWSFKVIRNEDLKNLFIKWMTNLISQNKDYISRWFRMYF